MHSPGWYYAESQRGTDLHRQEVPMLITMLDGLRQRHCLGNYPRRAPAFSRQFSLAIGSHKYGCIPMPPIAEPGEGGMGGSLHRGGHPLVNEILVQGAAGPGDPQEARPSLDQAS